MPVATYSAAGPQSRKMGAIENTIEVANGQVPRHDLAQVEIRNVRRHRGDCGLGRFVGPEAVGLLNAPRGSSDDPSTQFSELVLPLKGGVGVGRKLLGRTRVLVFSKMFVQFSCNAKKGGAAPKCTYKSMPYWARLSVFPGGLLGAES